MADDLHSWQRIEPILERALDLSRDERAAFLDGACGLDRDLRSRIEGMLEAGEDPDHALEHPIADIAGPLLLDSDDGGAPPIAVGAAIGPWRLVRELGHGGMGEVFFAERDDGQFAQNAALKVVVNSLSALSSYRAGVGDSAVARSEARTAYAGLRRTMGERHDWTLLAGQRLAAVQPERALVDTVLGLVREKYPRVPPAFARIVGIDGALRAARGDSAGATLAFAEALGALKTGTRIDSAALGPILADSRRR